MVLLPLSPIAWVHICTAERRLWRQFTAFAKFRNVTDVGVDFEFYGPSTPAVARFQQRERYGALWTIGLKGVF